MNKSIVALALYFLTASYGLAQWSVSETQHYVVPAGLEFEGVQVTFKGRTEQVDVVSFNPKKLSFGVMDDPERFFNLETASKKRGALAAVNGGYFQPDRTPVGLVIRQGHQLHALQHAPLLSGVLVVTKTQTSILRVGEFKPSPNILEALQAGPFLVDGGKAVSGLNGLRVAARTVVFIDNSGRCGFLNCHSATLAETADILLTPGLIGPGRRITRALNLDGGSSTGLWVAAKPVYYQPEGKEVRNYLAIVPRAPAVKESKGH